MRRGTAAQWALVNPVLLSGEPGLATDTGELALGDGVTPWQGLRKHLPSGQRLLDFAASTVTPAQGKSAQHVLEGLAPVHFEVTDRPVIVSLRQGWTIASGGNIVVASALCDGADTITTWQPGSIGTTTLVAGQNQIAVTMPLVEEVLTVPGEYERRGEAMKISGAAPLTFIYHIAASPTLLKVCEW